MSEDEIFSMVKVAKTWTSPRLYEIRKDGKAILKLKDEDDAKQVLEYLNKNKCGKSKKKSSKKTTKKSSSKKSTGKKK